MATSLSVSLSYLCEKQSGELHIENMRWLICTFGGLDFQLFGQQLEQTAANYQNWMRFLV